MHYSHLASSHCLRKQEKNCTASLSHDLSQDNDSCLGIPVQKADLPVAWSFPGPAKSTAPFGEVGHAEGLVGHSLLRLKAKWTMVHFASGHKGLAMLVPPFASIRLHRHKGLLVQQGFQPSMRRALCAFLRPLMVVEKANGGHKGLAPIKMDTMWHKGLNTWAAWIIKSTHLSWPYMACFCITEQFLSFLPQFGVTKVKTPNP